MAPASSHSTLMIRVYACLLQALGEAAHDKTFPTEVLDPYWTLVGYFNSLRVLGGARMQVQDDVDGYMKVIAGRNDTRQRELADEPIELTSRRPSSEMKPSLNLMSKRCDDPRCPDVVIATNMISVGVDIDRLGLMVIMGQPQGTSEYIQASSRVGRQHPGLVVTLFNSARTRDRSHYESFPTYHSALYRRVESSSITPFSTRARDRGLHAVIVSLLRHTVTQLSSNPDAQNIEQHEADIAASQGNHPLPHRERVLGGGGGVFKARGRHHLNVEEIGVTVGPHLSSPQEQQLLARPSCTRTARLRSSYSHIE